MKNFLHLACALILLMASSACTSDDDPGDPPGDDDDDDVGDDDSSDDDDSVGDDDTAGEVEQAPITFVIVNDSADDRYFQWLDTWDDDIHVILSCASQGEDGSWSSCLFGVPYTAVDCSPAVEDGYCHHEVDGGERVYLLPPGRSLEIPWSGKRWVGDPEYCADGVCYWPHDPHEGHYGVSVMLWDEMVCLNGQCPDPGEDGGTIGPALPSGNSASHYVEFDLPCGDENLTIHVE